MTPLMMIHVFLGSLAILSGFIGLFSKKGQRVHRLAGKTFVFSMVTMSLVGSYIAYHKPEMITLLAGLFTSYLVVSAFVTVSSSRLLTSWPVITLVVYALSLGCACFYYGYLASQSADKVYDGFPAEPYFFFGSLAWLAAVLDVKVLLQKGIAGVQRIARHAWRMCFALFIATSSLFDGPGANSFPNALHGSPLLLIPQCLVIILLIYWLFRILYLKKGVLSLSHLQVANRYYITLFKEAPPVKFKKRCNIKISNKSLSNKGYRK